MYIRDTTTYKCSVCGSTKIERYKRMNDDLFGQLSGYRCLACKREVADCDEEGGTTQWERSKDNTVFI